MTTWFDIPPDCTYRGTVTRNGGASIHHIFETVGGTDAETRSQSTEGAG
jgi:hypothetical protein